MTDTKKQSKKEQAKAATRELMIKFLASHGTPKKALDAIRERLADDSSVPTFTDSPDLLIVRHPFTLQRQTARKAIK